MGYYLGGLGYTLWSTYRSVHLPNPLTRTNPEARKYGVDAEVLPTQPTQHSDPNRESTTAVGLCHVDKSYLDRLGPSGTGRGGHSIWGRYLDKSLSFLEQLLLERGGSKVDTSRAQHTQGRQGRGIIDKLVLLGMN
jgi:hypothetical protein